MNTPSNSPATPSGSLTGFILLGVTALFFGATLNFAKLSFDGEIDALSLQVFGFSITFAAVLLMVWLIVTCHESSADICRAC